jgi:hypothetical protein
VQTSILEEEEKKQTKKTMEVEIQKEKDVEKNANKMEERKMRKQITFLCHLHICTVQDTIYIKKQI